jgi:hypothetical protein
MEDSQCHLRFTFFVSGFYLDETCFIYSLLLGSTILITEALDDPVTRTAALLSLMCVDETYLWLYVYCEIWYDEKHVPYIHDGLTSHRSTFPYIMPRTAGNLGGHALNRISLYS